MTLSIDDLFTAPTSDQIRANMVANLQSLGIPADKWTKGGVASTILTVCAIALSLTGALIVQLLKGFFLPTAAGNNLKLLAKYMFGVTVPDATFASGTVTLTNGGGGTFGPTNGGGVGQFVCQNPTTKVTYTNDIAFTLAPNGTATVHVIANTAGAAGNAVPGAITQIVTGLLLVTVTNPSALVGIDAPSDSTIRTLCLNSLGVLGVRGVRTAYAYAVQTAVNSVTGAPVNINRWQVTSASHTSDVEVIVASPSGAPDPNDVTGVANNVELLARPEGVAANVSGATTAAYTPSITIWASAPASVTDVQIKAACDTALLNFITAYPIGGVSANDDAHPSTPLSGLFASAIYGVCAQAVASLGGTFLSGQGATDLGYLSGQVATDSITTTVRLVAPVTGTTSS